eukprot:SAG11_NODE_872_length_6802_cov_8.951514_9_plen_136_part_00
MRCSHSPQPVTSALADAARTGSVASPRLELAHFEHTATKLSSTAHPLQTLAALLPARHFVSAIKEALTGAAAIKTPQPNRLRLEITITRIEAIRLTTRLPTWRSVKICSEHQGADSRLLASFYLGKQERRMARRS